MYKVCIQYRPGIEQEAASIGNYLLDIAMDELQCKLPIQFLELKGLQHVAVVCITTDQISSPTTISLLSKGRQIMRELLPKMSREMYITPVVNTNQQ